MSVRVDLFCHYLARKLNKTITETKNIIKKTFPHTCLCLAEHYECSLCFLFSFRGQYVIAA